MDKTSKFLWGIWIRTSVILLIGWGGLVLSSNTGGEVAEWIFAITAGVMIVTLVSSAWYTFLALRRNSQRRNDQP